MAFKAALITGASSGIGEALALELAERGCSLALAARREDKLNEVAAKACEYGVEVYVYPCDTQDREAVETTAYQALSDFGEIDLVILNAGVGGSVRVDRFEMDRVEEVVYTNFMGALYWIEPLMKPMLTRDDGVIVGVSSLAGRRGVPKGSAYSASKAALSTFFESLRVELRECSVRAVLVEPGFVRTPLSSRNRIRPFLMEPPQAAKLILNRIERGKNVIRFPWPMAMVAGLAKVLPNWFYDWMISRVR